MPLPFAWGIAGPSQGIRAMLFQRVEPGEMGAAMFITPDDMKTGEPLPGWKGRYFHSDAMSFADYEASAGSSIHEHQHSNEEVWIVITGKLEVSIDGETVLAGPGCVAVVPPDVSHSVRVLEDARALVADHPVRHMI